MPAIAVLADRVIATAANAILTIRFMVDSQTLKRSSSCDSSAVLACSARSFRNLISAMTAPDCPAARHDRQFDRVAALAAEHFSRIRQYWRGNDWAATIVLAGR
ncbi:hypothetical protein BURK_002215 [Burkholderia sp. SJ98]|nr:hypothetical protein BURK_002215 [Burkholderia sp. SJ98]